METKIITCDAIGANFLHRMDFNKRRLKIFERSLLPTYMFEECGKVVYTVLENKIIACRIIGFLCCTSSFAELRPAYIKVSTAEGATEFIQGGKKYFRTLEDAFAWYSGDKEKGYDYIEGIFHGSRTITELGLTDNLITTEDNGNHYFGVGKYYWFDGRIREEVMFPRCVYVNADGVYFIKGTMQDEKEYLMSNDNLTDAMFNKYYKRLYATKEECLKANAPTIVDFIEPAEPYKEEIKIEDEPESSGYIVFKMEK